MNCLRHELCLSAREREATYYCASAVIFFANANSDMCPQARKSDATYYLKLASIFEGGGPLAVEGEKNNLFLVIPFNAFSLRLLRSQLPPGGRHVLLHKRSDIRARWLRVILPYGSDIVC